MDLDPHTLQEIIHRIYQQMRCPQCGKTVPINFASVQIAGEDFLLLRLHCETCDAHIVLHATLRGSAERGAKSTQALLNASSTLNLKEEEVKLLEKALEESGGSFEALFGKYGGEEQLKIEN